MAATSDSLVARSTSDSLVARSTPPTCCATAKRRCKKLVVGLALVAAIVALVYSRLAWTGPGAARTKRWYRPSTWRDYANSLTPTNSSARLAHLERDERNASAAVAALAASSELLAGRVDELEREVAALSAGGGGGSGASSQETRDALRNASLEVARQGEAVDALRARLDEDEKEEKKDIDALEQSLGEYREATGAKLDDERDLIYHWIAGTFTLLCCLIAAAGAFSHSRAFAFPEVQRKILALLWMPPIYGLCCWLSLLYPLAAPGLSMVRDGYEAYTIWVFVSFLVSVLGEEADGDAEAGLPTPGRRGRKNQRSKYAVVVAKLAADDDSGAHVLPRAFCPPPCCGRKPPAKKFLRQCMIAVLQFVLFKPVLSVGDYVLTMVPYERASREPWVDRARLVVLVCMNVSVSVALTGLLKVYHATAHRLERHGPWPKFCCVKGVVFLTFWQGTVIWALTCSESANPFASKEMADAVQNFLICVEMFVASVVHSYTFSADEWQPGYRPQPQIQVSDNFAAGDFFNDVKYAFARGSVSRKASTYDARSPLSPGSEEDLASPDAASKAGDDAAPPPPPPPPPRTPSADGRGPEDAEVWSAAPAAAANDGDASSDDEQDGRRASLLEAQLTATRSGLRPVPSPEKSVPSPERD
ncbi:hypothetical protein JL722_7682 [Aureococcus anophagefferens]|nr:hypothetical protein JL722_7682 [Aureococcus anophagefferens]